MTTTTISHSRPAVTAALADWIATAPRCVDADVLARAYDGLRDTIACMVAGAGDEAAARVRESMLAYGNGPARVVGAHASAAAPWAAMANGMAAHVLDFDDNYLPAFTHASAVLVPALLALGDAHDCDGGALIDAYIIGLEAHAFIGRGLGRQQYDLGWHSTSTVGCVGTAGACARLLGLDETQTMHALSLAVSLASGPKVQFGSPAKPFHAGMAAHNAVLAATLAASGMTARGDAIEGERGLMDLYAGQPDIDWAPLVTSLGAPLALAQFGLAPKLYPCCGSAHKILDGVLDLRAAHGFQASDVRQVDALVGHGNLRNLCYPEPTQEMEARFSLNYCIALALQYGALKLADFTPSAVERAEVRALLPVTNMRAYPVSAEGADSTVRLAHEVTIELYDGTRLNQRVESARGTFERPFTEAEKRAKFDDCCAAQLPGASKQSLETALQEINTLPSIRSLTESLQFDAGADRGERFQRAA